jgi:hypothetical protein
VAVAVAVLSQLLKTVVLKHALVLVAVAVAALQQ